MSRSAARSPFVCVRAIFTHESEKTQAVGASGARARAGAEARSSHLVVLSLCLFIAPTLPAVGGTHGSNLHGLAVASPIRRPAECQISGSKRRASLTKPSRLGDASRPLESRAARLRWRRKFDPRALLINQTRAPN